MAIALTVLAPIICSASPRTLVGAIRWDAWVGDTPTPGHTIPVGLQMETALGPRQFHDRIAFYGKETGPDSVEIRELTQDIMDKEIRYAHDAGIDYWAFDWYSDATGLATARHLYLSSKIKNLIKFCFMWPPPRADYPTLVNKYFKDPSYLKVLGGRPVLYLLQDTSPADLAALREQTRAAGLGDPYIVKTDGRGAQCAASAFDDKMSTYWQAEAGRFAGEWLEVDFGAKTTFDKAILAEKGEHTSAYEIRCWDGSQWLTAYSGTTIGDAKSPTTVTFPPATSTRARVCFLSGTQQPEVYEVKIYNTAASPNNLALGNKYEASSIAYHYEALSHYMTRAFHGAPYSQLMRASRDLWDLDKSYGLDVVPIVSFGADSRPLILYGDDWGGKYPEYCWDQEPTPSEGGALLKQALDWIDANPSVDPARLVLIYAWNEFSEGGWICPTLLHGSDRLDAIHKVLSDYGKK